MSDATRHFFSGSWPEFYDRLMVPVFFEPYARRLAERLKDMTSGHVMEIAAGTGVVTRELIRTLPELCQHYRHRSQPAHARSCSIPPRFGTRQLAAS
jgi:hypothetical protein